MLKKCTKRGFSEHVDQHAVNFAGEILLPFAGISAPYVVHRITEWLDAFYAFKWFGMPWGMWRYPSRHESFQSKELGNLCLISEHSIIATCFTPSTFKGTTFPWWLCFPFNCTICCLTKNNNSQGYVNKTLCSCGSKFISASIDSQTHSIEILFYFL